VTLAQPDCFTLTYELGTNDPDLIPAGPDPDLVPLTGPVRVEPQPRDRKPIQTPAGGLRPRSFQGYLDSDGVLKDRAGGTPGMRVWLNDPAWEIAEYWYAVKFDVATGMGETVAIDGGFFEAPTTDIVIPLQQVLASTGSSIVATGRQLGLYVGDIIGAGAAGRAVLTSSTAAAARTAIGATAVGANVFTATDQAAARNATHSLAGSVYDAAGSPVTNKGARVVLDSNGDIDDIIMEGI
jgi:hypothetical protein